MTVTPGSIVKAEEYNSVADLANLIFGDNYSSAQVTDLNRILTHKFGWGADNLDDQVPVGVLIEAERLQYLVNHTNVMIDHVDISDNFLVFSVPQYRTDVKRRTLVRAEDLNLVEDKINNTIIPRDTHATVDPGNASLLSPESNGYTRETPWQNRLTGEHMWSWTSYNSARYFFNGGGQLQLSLEMTGGCTAGYFNWADIVNEVGSLTFTWNNLYQSAGYQTPGLSEGKGFYHLTDRYGDGSDPDGVADDEGLLFTSAGVTQTAYGYGYGYGYGYTSTGPGMFVDNVSGYASAYRVGQDCIDPVYLIQIPTVGGYGYGYSEAYSNYANRYFKLYGKWVDNGAAVQFKIVFDDTAFEQITDGRLEATPRYLMPDVITENTSTFDVSPDPQLSIVDNFNTSDDS